MKRLANCIIVVAVMFGTFISNANETTKPVTYVNSYITEKEIHVLIIDEMGKTIFSTEVKDSTQFYETFNFSLLKDGVYTVEVNYDHKVEITEVEVTQDKVNVLESDKTVFFKPSIKVDKNKIIIRKLASQDDEMKVEIFYKKDKIYKDVLEGENILARAYLLDETLKGNYAVQIKTNGRIYDAHFKY